MKTESFYFDYLDKLDNKSIPGSGVSLLQPRFLRLNIRFDVQLIKDIH